MFVSDKLNFKESYDKRKNNILYGAAVHICCVFDWYIYLAILKKLNVVIKLQEITSQEPRSVVACNMRAARLRRTHAYEIRNMSGLQFGLFNGVK